VSKEIYFFSGLGADERVFQFLNPEGCKPIFIRWIRPEENEPVERYASRILPQIKSTKPVLVGLSFGGIVAIEIARLIETEKVILISSVKTRNEIPYYLRLTGNFYLHKILPAWFYKKAKRPAFWFFGTESQTEEELLSSIIDDTDWHFAKWATDEFLHWKNAAPISNVIHVHGTCDRILPYRFVKADIAVNHGGHFMVVSKGSKLSEILTKILRQS